MVKNQIIALATEVIEGRLSGLDYRAKQESLFRLLSDDNQQSDVNGFALHIDSAPTYSFDDQELMASDNLTRDQVTNELRINFIREHLKSELENPSEDTPSRHSLTLRLSDDSNLFICALVHIAGHEAVTSWWGVYGSLEEFNEELFHAGYVTSDTDCDLVSDEQLLALWWEG